MTPTTKKKSHPAIGGIIRFEGHDYKVTGHAPMSDDVKAAFTQAGVEVPEGDERYLVFERQDARTPNKSVMCNTSDIKDSGEGWFFLPCRVGPPLGGDVHNGKQLSPEFPPQLKEKVRTHPDYLTGRDDLAAAAVAKDAKMDWPVHLSDPKFASLHVLRTKE